MSFLCILCLGPFHQQPVGLRQNLHPNLALARDLAQFLPYLPQKEQEQEQE